MEKLWQEMRRRTLRNSLRKFGRRFRKAVQEGGVALLGKRKADGVFDGHAEKKVRMEPEA